MANTKNNLSAKNEWLDMVFVSWTWGVLTPTERNTFIDRVNQFEYNGELAGTYKQRWGILNALYTVYLDGIGRNEIDRRDKAYNETHTA